MREVYSEAYALSVKSGFANARAFLASILTLCIITGFGYLMFWVGAISDETFFNYGKSIFEPLAAFLNQGSGGKEIYLNTSLMFLASFLPAYLIQYLMNKTEDLIVKEHNKKIEKMKKKEEKEAYKNYMARFDSIQTYSICLSIDYENKNKQIVTPKTKTKLNKAIYDKIGSSLKAIEPMSKITINDVLIFTSHNFSRYDRAYDTILKNLTNIKYGIEQTYKYKLIPSMTTDAYSNGQTDYGIRRQHFEIQSFNFKNRALSTATFANKYKHLQHNKYAGVPIGEYVYFGGGKTDTYELNVIHKNLEGVLK